MSDFNRPGPARIERVLVIDPNGVTAKMLANLLRSVWPYVQIYGAPNAAHAMALASDILPQLIFTEAMAPGLDGLAFTRGLRRSDHPCREAPVIMVFAEVTVQQILLARDAGVHEFMRRPYTLGDLQKRLDAVSSKPRDWIEAMNYVGPDRRRFNSADYQGPRKRRADSLKAQKLEAALKIVQMAAQAVDTDPAQALRALTAQARALVELSATQDQLKPLGKAAVQLQAYLQGVGGPQGLNKQQVTAIAAGLVRAAPDEYRPKAA